MTHARAANVIPLEPQPHPFNDEERQRQTASLEEKRKDALAFLGDRHLLKGGKWQRGCQILNLKRK